MQKAYALRPDYEDTFVGGSVITGHEGGMLNITEALGEGDGQIKTDDQVLQSLLENYYGAHGLMFDVFTVDEETGEQTKVESHQPPNVGITAPAPGPPSPPNPDAPQGSAGSAPPAEHGDQASGYEGLTVKELQEIATEREIQFNTRASKDELISALENDDNEGDDS